MPATFQDDQYSTLALIKFHLYTHPNTNRLETLFISSWQV